MGDKRFVKIAPVMSVLVLIVLSAILPPTTSTRPLNGEAMVVGRLALDQVPVPPIGPSPCTHVPSIPKGRCLTPPRPLRTSRNG